MPLLLELRTSGLCLITAMIGVMDPRDRLVPMPVLCGRAGGRDRGLLGETGATTGVDLGIGSGGNAVRHHMMTGINVDEWRALHEVVLSSFGGRWWRRFLSKACMAWIRVYVMSWHFEQPILSCFIFYIRYGISLSRRVHYCSSNLANLPAKSLYMKSHCLHDSPILLTSIVLVNAHQQPQLPGRLGKIADEQESDINAGLNLRARHRGQTRL